MDQDQKPVGEAPIPAPAPPCSILHEMRTVENSGAYFLSELRKLHAANPKLRVLDVGSGWGSITASFAKVVAPEGKVVGIDVEPKAVTHARNVAIREGVAEQVELIEADAYKLPFADGEFDVAHCHQVLAHLVKPWDVLAEMVRVTKPGGFIVAREGDLESEITWPSLPGIEKWHNLVVTAMNARGQGGGGSNTGRQLLPWALRIGIPRKDVTLTYGTWSFDLPDHKKKWADAMAGQVRSGQVREIAIKMGLATEVDCKEMADAWDSWATMEDSSVAMIHGEVLIRKPGN